MYNDIFDHIERQRKRIRKLAKDNTWATGFLAASEACREILQENYSDTEKQ